MCIENLIFIKCNLHFAVGVILLKPEKKHTIILRKKNSLNCLLMTLDLITGNVYTKSHHFSFKKQNYAHEIYYALTMCMETFTRN